MVYNKQDVTSDRKEVLEIPCIFSYKMATYMNIHTIEMEKVLSWTVKVTIMHVSDVESLNLRPPFPIPELLIPITSIILQGHKWIASPK